MNIKNFFQRLGSGNVINQVDNTIVTSIMNNTKNVVDDILRASNPDDLIRNLSSTLKNNQTYKKIYVDAVEEASRVKYGKTFDDLTKSSPNEAKALAQEIHKNLSKDVTNYLTVKQRTANAQYSSNKQAYDNLSRNRNASQVDLNQSKTFFEKSLAKKTTIDEFKKVFKGLPTSTYDDILEIIGTPNAQQIPNPINPGKWITKFTIPKKTLIKLGALGIGGIAIWGLYSAFAGDKDIILESEDGTPIPTDFAKYGCMMEFLKNGTGVISTASDGSKAIKVTNDEYPQGLLFYGSGKVQDIAGKKNGTFSCKSGQQLPTIQESKKLSLINILIEQLNDIEEVAAQTVNDDEIAADVETMIDLLDFPVGTQDLKDAHTLLSKYVNNGKAKEFLELYQESGFGSGNLGKSIKYISAIQADTVIAKKKLQNLYNQIVSGTATTTTSSSGSSSVNDVVSITWDSSGGGQGGGQTSGGSQIPPELGNTQGVMAFQDWLDKKTKSWHKKYGKLYGDRSKGYGIFGPNTSKAWEDYKIFYLKELQSANNTPQDGSSSTNDILPDVMRKSSSDYQKDFGNKPGSGSISTAQQRADIERIKRERGL
jgi:hypothetical protein